jgi:hypothetical protein
MQFDNLVYAVSYKEKHEHHRWSTIYHINNYKSNRKFTP